MPSHPESTKPKKTLPKKAATKAKTRAFGQQGAAKRKKR